MRCSLSKPLCFCDMLPVQEYEMGLFNERL